MTTLSQLDRLLGTWSVSVMGRRDSSFEIAVVLDANVHGRNSWGWEGNDKIMVLRSGGVIGPLSQEDWDRALSIAGQMAARLSGVAVAEPLQATL